MLRHSVGRPLGEDIQCQTGHHDGQTWEECHCHQRPARTPAGRKPGCYPMLELALQYLHPMKVRDASKDDCVCANVTVKTVIGAMQLRRTCFHRSPWCTSTRKQWLPLHVNPRRTRLHDVCTEQLRAVCSVYIKPIAKTD